MGQIYLLHPSGRPTGRGATVAGDGTFDFQAIPVGDYQAAFQAPGLARVVEGIGENPADVTISPNEVSRLTFVIEVGGVDPYFVEIYAGDYFFQEQPAGDMNADVSVQEGATVCWYNVGEAHHTVTGGPWGDSGSLAPRDNFMWTATKTGHFFYECTLHSTRMRASLTVHT